MNKFVVFYNQYVLINFKGIGINGCFVKANIRGGVFLHLTLLERDRLLHQV